MLISSLRRRPAAVAVAIEAPSQSCDWVNFSEPSAESLFDRTDVVAPRKVSSMTRTPKSPRPASDLSIASATALVDTVGTAFVAPPQLTTFDRPASPPSAFLNGEGAAARPPRTLDRIPLLPSDLLKQHHCFVSTDTRFRAAARFLQSLWRGDAQIPIGMHVSPTGDKPTRIKLGSRLHFKAARGGLNFVAPEVHQLVRRELILREEGAVIDVDRLFANALSSMPLCFNLLGPLALDLDLATAVWRRLLPDFVHTVEGISFEHSPGRGDARFLSDGTAFDAVIRVINPNGNPATVFIELKYSEGMTGPAAAHGPRHDAASRQVRFYHDPDSAALRSTALEQLWREHMLAQLAVDNGIADRAVFVAIGPRLNRRVAAAFRLYAEQLADKEAEDELRVDFRPIPIEAVIEAIAETKATNLAQKLWFRYLDFPRVYEHALAADIPNPSFKRLEPHSSPTPKRAASKNSAGQPSETPADQSSPATSAPGAEER